MANTFIFTLHTLTYKRGTVPSVTTAQDEMQAHCRKVYGPGEWGHCLHVAIEMCIRREKISSYTGNDFWDSHPSRFTFGRSPLVFWANIILFFFLFTWTCFLGLQSQGGREVKFFVWWRIICLAVAKNVNLSSLFKMCDTHGSALYTVIGHVYWHLTTHLIFMLGCILKKRKKPSCLRIHLRVRCHPCSHEPLVWMSYK